MKSLMLKVMLVLMTVAVGTSVALADPNCDQQASSSTQGILHQACSQDPSLAGCNTGDQKLNASCSATPGSTTYLQDILDTFFLAAGLVALIFVLLGGIRYITSTGDSARVKQAKDTILYAVIGLIVAVLAVPISGFVINRVAGG